MTTVDFPPLGSQGKGDADGDSASGSDAKAANWISPFTSHMVAQM